MRADDVNGNREVAIPVLAVRTLVRPEVGLHLPSLRMDHVVPRRVGQSGAHLRASCQTSLLSSTLFKCHQPSRLGEEPDSLRWQQQQHLCFLHCRQCILECFWSCSPVVVAVVVVVVAVDVVAFAFAAVAAALAEDTVPGKAVAGRGFERRESLV